MPDNIEATVEQYLAALPEADWQALCARVRPPGEGLRDFTADLFGIAEDTEPDEPGEPQHNIIRGEGPNPEAKPDVCATLREHPAFSVPNWARIATHPSDVQNAQPVGQAVDRRPCRVVTGVAVDVTGHRDPSAFSTGDKLIIVAWIAQAFLQLVLLPIIIVGQNVQAQSAEQRAQATYDDASAVLEEAKQIQAHMYAQDAQTQQILAKLTEFHDAAEQRVLIETGRPSINRTRLSRQPG